MEQAVYWVCKVKSELSAWPSIYDAAKVAASRLDVSGNLTSMGKKDMEISVMWKKLHLVK
jgi:hypothetical protein